MPSSYTNNLRLEEMATGEKATTWGDITNSNLELIGAALGYGEETIADSDTVITMSDGAADAVRSMYLKVLSSADLTATRTVTLAPNTVSKMWIIENATTGSQSITISQGSGGNVTIPNGRVKVIVTDGGGSAAVVYDALQDASISDLLVDNDLTVGDDVILSSDGAIVNFGADSEIQLTHVADTGLILTETGGGSPTLQIRDSALSISSSADGQLDLAADVELQFVAPTVDIDASTAMTVNTSTLTVTGNTVADGDFTLNGASYSAVWDKSDNALEFADNAKASFGTDSDLSISHDGTNSLIENNTGELNVQGDGITLRSVTGTETFLTMDVNDGVDLYFNNSKKFETTNTGVDITGTATMDGLTVDGGIEVKSINATVLLTDTDASDYSRIRHNTGSLIFEADEGDTVADSAIRFDVDGDEKMRITDNNGVLIGKTVSNPNSQGIILSTAGTVSANAFDNIPLNLNRDDTSGTGNQLAAFSAADTVVGSIRYISTGFAIDGEADHAGIRFGGSALVPRKDGDDEDALVSLGNANVRWSTVYASTGTINTSDRNAKQQIASLTAAEITAAKAISQLFKTFKFNRSVADKGDAARTHTGVIAQDIETALTNSGLNAGDYAFFTSDTWWESDGATYYTLADAPAGATERNIKGIRYSELLSFVSAATEQRLADIETRLTALEA